MTKQDGSWSGQSRAARNGCAERDGHSPAGPSTPACAKESIRSSCTSSADALGTPPGEQFGRDQRRLVAALLT